jgi:hypothetical protein
MRSIETARIALRSFAAADALLESGVQQFVRYRLEREAWERARVLTGKEIAQ